MRFSADTRAQVIELESRGLPAPLSRSRLPKFLESMCSLSNLLLGQTCITSEDNIEGDGCTTSTPNAHPWLMHGLCALPDVLLCDILTTVSRRTGSLDFALVCRPWRDMAFSTLSFMSPRPGVRLPLDTLLQQATQFQNVTSLHLTPSSVLSLDDHFLLSIPLRLPTLTHLSIDKSSSVEISLSHRGLSSLVFGLPHLLSLSLPDLGYALGLPDAIGNLPLLSSLSSLRLRGPLPDSIGGLKSLKFLHLGSNTVQELPLSVSLLSSLTSLTLELLELQHLPEESVKGWVRLQHCSITSRVLWYLPGSFSELRELRTLSLRCRELQEVPEGLERLARLAHMELFSRGLVRFPVGFKDLVALKVLEAGKALNTQQHHHTPPPPQQDERTPPVAAQEARVFPTRSLSQAQSVEMSEGVGESQAPEQVLPVSLHTLLVSSFWGQALPDSICCLPRLKVLSIQVCPSLKGLPASLGTLRTLKELSIDLCALEMLPPSLCDLKDLQKLSLSNCAAFRRLPDELGALSALTELRIEGCSNLEGFPRSFCQLSGLRTLCLVGCHSLRSLPLDVGNLRLMRCLDIVRCRGLEMLPHSMGELACLERLVLEDNSAMRTLPESISRLTCLKELHILGCSNLARVPLGEQQMMLLPAQSLSQIQRSKSPNKKAQGKPKGYKSKWVMPNFLF